MGFFNIGDIIILSVVLIFLIFFRRKDVSGRALDSVRRYGERVRKDFEDFVSEKKKAIKDLSIEFDVQRDVGEAILKRSEEAFQGLEGTVKKLNGVEENIDKLNRQTVELRTTTLEASQSLNGIRSEINDMNLLRERFEDLASKSEEIEDFFRRNLEESEKKIEERLEEIADHGKDAFEKSLLDTLDHLKEESRKIDDLKKDINNLSALSGKAQEGLRREFHEIRIKNEAQLNKQCEDAENRISEGLAHAEDSLRDNLRKSENVGKHIQSLLAEFKENESLFRIEEEAFSRRIEVLREEASREREGIDLLRQEWETHRKEVAEEEIRQTHEWDSRREEVTNLIDTAGEKTESLLSEAARTFEVRLNEFSTDAEKRFDSLELTIQTRFKGITDELATSGTSSEQRIGALKDKFNSYLEEIDEEINSRLSGVEVAVRSQINAFEREMAAEDRGMDARINKLVNDFNDRLLDLNQSVEDRINQFEKIASEQTVENRNAMNSRLELVNNDFDARMKSLDSAINNRLAGIEGEVLNKVETINKLLDERGGDVRTRVEELAASLEEQKETVLKEWKDRIGSLSGEMELRLETDIESLSKDLRNRRDEFAKEAVSHFEEFQEDWSLRFDTLEGSVQDQAAELKRFLKSSDENALSETQKLIEKIKETQQAAESQMAERSRLFIEEIADRMNAQEEELKSRSNEFFKTDEELKERFEELRETLDSKKGEITDRLSAIENSLHEMVTAQIEEINEENVRLIEEKHQKTIADISGAASEQEAQILGKLETERNIKMQEMHKEMDELNKSLTMLHDRIVEIEGFETLLDEKTKSAGETFRTEVERTLDSLKDEEERIRSKMLSSGEGEVQRIEEMLTGFKDMLSGLNGEIAELTRQSEFIQTQDKDLKSHVEGIRESLDEKEQEIAERLSEVESAFKSAVSKEASKLNEENARLVQDRFDKTMDELSSAVTERETQIHAMLDSERRTRADEVRSEIEGLRATLSALRERIVATEEFEVRFDRKIRTIEENLKTEANRTLASLKQEGDRLLRETISSGEEEVARFEETFSGFREALAGIDDKMAELSKQNLVLQERDEDLRTHANEIRTSLDSKERDIMEKISAVGETLRSAVSEEAAGLKEENAQLAREQREVSDTLHKEAEALLISMREERNRGREEMTALGNAELAQIKGTLSNFRGLLDGIGEDITALREQSSIIEGREAELIAHTEEAKTSIDKKEAEIAAKISRLEITLQDTVSKEAEKVYEKNAHLIQTHYEKTVSGLIDSVSEREEKLISAFESELINRKDVLREELSTIENSMALLKEKMEAANEFEPKIQQETESALNVFREEAERALVTLKNQGSRTREEIISSSMAEKKQMEEILASFKDAEMMTEKRFLDLIAKYNGEFDKILAEKETKVEEEKQKWLTTLDKARLRQETLANELLTSLDDRLREDIERTIFPYKEEFERHLGDFEGKVKEETDRFREIIERTKDEAGEFDSKFEAKKGGMIDHLEKTVEILNADISEALRRQDEYLTNLKLIEKTEEMKNDISRDIDFLRGQKRHIGEMEERMIALKQEQERIRQTGGELSERLSSILGKEDTVLLLQERLRDIASSRQRIESERDTLIGVEEKLSRFFDEIQRINEYEKELQPLLNTVGEHTQTIEGFFEKVERGKAQATEFEDRIENLRLLLSPIEKKAEDIEALNTRLSEQQNRMTATSEKLETMEQTVASLEKKSAQIDQAREWMARTETRMKEIAAEVQENINALETVVRGGDTPGRKGSATAPDMEMRNTVVRLKEQGWSNEEISRATRLSLGEIELILEVGGRL